MPSYSRYSGSEPQGSVVVRIVASAEGPRAFIRRVADPADPAPESVEESEELPVAEALALAENKRTNIEGGARIVVELGPETDWDPAWGEMETARL